MKFRNRERFEARPAAIIFDLDNTLYEYEPAHSAALLEVTRKLEALMRLPPDKATTEYKAARDRVKGRLPRVAASHSRLLYFQDMLETIGLGNEATLFLDVEQTYWRTYLANSVLFPQVEETLIAINRKSIPIAIVTDLTAQIQFRKISHLGLEGHISAIVTTEEAGIDKAGLRPFTRALEKLELPAGATVWSIGDDRADIGAAREAIGAVTVQKLYRGAPDYAADATFSEFSELLAQVESY